MHQTVKSSYLRQVKILRDFVTFMFYFVLHLKWGDKNLKLQFAHKCYSCKNTDAFANSECTWKKVEFQLVSHHQQQPSFNNYQHFLCIF